MAHHFTDNVYTHTFTPCEYQVELLDSAMSKNTIACCSTSSSKNFLVVKLLQRFLYTNYNKHALVIAERQNLPALYSYVERSTCTHIIVYMPDNGAIKSPTCENDWGVLTEDEPSTAIFTTAEVVLHLVRTGHLQFENFCLLVFDDCLHIDRQALLEAIMNEYKKVPPDVAPRILGLAGGLLGSELRPHQLEYRLEHLEKILCSSVDTSSELVTLLRLCSRPRERLLEYSTKVPAVAMPLEEETEQILQDARMFLEDHRYDLTEIYGDYSEELKEVPDPKEQPLIILQSLLDILHDLGPWAVNEAVINMLPAIQNLETKVQYERHFLLLRMTFTTLVKIHGVCTDAFKKLTEVERLFQYSSIKMIRFIDVITHFKPPGEKPPVVEVENEAVSLPGKPRGKGGKGNRRIYPLRSACEETLCALVFVNDRVTAKVVFSALCVLNKFIDEYWWISAAFIVEKIKDPIVDSKAAESEHRMQEEILQRYRSHNCNILISTSVLEQGCDIPKCNLVVRFDLPKTFQSYVKSKARARAPDAQYISLVKETDCSPFIDELAEYMEVERTLLRRCHGLGPDKEEELEADLCSLRYPPYQPLSEPNAPFVSLKTAIALVNRYCAKLPSDTFTRLTPIWDMQNKDGRYTCNLRLPINSPIKQTVTCPPMVNPLLARRAAAFLMCQLLHKSGELDDNLHPIGKENFHVDEKEVGEPEVEEEDLSQDNEDARPGTTKRRQFYYKRVAKALTDCYPVAFQCTYFYKIVMTLTCPLPDEQNTRGRRIYPPEESAQGFGILTCRKIPKICGFPIFTRCGEVNVEVELCSSSLVLDVNQRSKISMFTKYLFTDVLRLTEFRMLFVPYESEMNCLITPTCITENGTEVDWDFLDIICKQKDVLPKVIPEETRHDYTFDGSHYKDAVVMPWYRNQDQPQYFYVAEICTNLNPKSKFPGSQYSTFEEYYLKKYGIQIQNTTQHLLDVDHTSARLNFLTPRYVNRKGVALPTSSEETKRAKRENLEQKQILVPELVQIHPFPASLWRKAVSLPCILYRLNALLLADEIRRMVVIGTKMGRIEPDDEFKWDSLNFGWSLSDVLKKSKEQELSKKEDDVEMEPVTSMEISLIESALDKIDALNYSDKFALETMPAGQSNSDSLHSAESNEWMEIGTWSNEMAAGNEGNSAMVVRYGSPTSWANHAAFDDSDSDDTYESDDENSDYGKFRIEFREDNTAEAVEDNSDCDTDTVNKLPVLNGWQDGNVECCSEERKEQFSAICSKNKSYLLSKEVLVKVNDDFVRNVRVPCPQVAANNVPVQEDNSLNIMFYDKTHDQCTCADDRCCDKCADHDWIPPTLDIYNHTSFSFDIGPDLLKHPGPAPSILLQALTMSNANDGINLERLETVGDSYLKFAVTNNLYCQYPNVHEGKLSFLRSKQVSNFNLYRLGKRKKLGEFMIATKFDPHDNWLPPCFYVSKEPVTDKSMVVDVDSDMDPSDKDVTIPYNIITQHSAPDKSIADCVEALIGAYLIELGQDGALIFMSWLGLPVLPLTESGYQSVEITTTPLLRNVPWPELELERLLDGCNRFEDRVRYRFRNRAYLLQAFTHASYSPNKLTDCYQRLEFLGDAVLDFLITYFLFKDRRMHSPGQLTDLRSALVNNTIFASLAVRFGFHLFFKHLSPGLQEVIDRFVRIQEENDHAVFEELYLIAEHESEEVEDVEVPKALGDVFESVAGAIFLDSGMSLDTVWSVYYPMMQSEIERFSDHVPKSPIRELLELEPETAKFGKPEKLADGRRVRVSVEVFGKGTFKGIGRNYRIAKCTAAKCALRHLKLKGLLKRN